MMCLGLIIRYNNFQRASIINTSNAAVGNLLDRVSNTSDYFALKIVNDSLVAENAKLIELLKGVQGKIDNNTIAEITRNVNLPKIDSLRQLEYSYIGARVINNTVNKVHNYLTLNKGTAHGIRHDMGVVGPQGVVGIVKDVSENFATVISLLHKSTKINARIDRSQFSGSLGWNTLDPRYAMLEDIPKHARVYVGDTIVTGGGSDFFPAKVALGVIEAWNSPTGNDFYDIKVRLATDFYNISYVYVVDYNKKKELKNLENRSTAN